MRGIDDFLVAHQRDDGVAALNGAIGKETRVVAGRRLGKRGERRGFGDVQILDRFAEVALRGRLDAVRAVAEVDLVEIQLEDAVLRVFRFDRARDLCLFQLADQRLVARQTFGENIARELHRDRREAFAEVAVLDVDDDRARHALPVDAGCW